MNAAPRSVFISGANRGIGLELVRQFLAISTPPKHIIATCRRPEEAAVSIYFIKNQNECALKLAVCIGAEYWILDVIKELNCFDQFYAKYWPVI